MSTREERVGGDHVTKCVKSVPWNLADLSLNYSSFTSCLWCEWEITQANLNLSCTSASEDNSLYPAKVLWKLNVKYFIIILIIIRICTQIRSESVAMHSQCVASTWVSEVFLRHGWPSLKKTFKILNSAAGRMHMNFFSVSKSIPSQLI